MGIGFADKSSLQRHILLLRISHNYSACNRMPRKAGCFPAAGCGTVGCGEEVIGSALLAVAELARIGHDGRAISIKKCAEKTQLVSGWHALYTAVGYVLYSSLYPQCSARSQPLT